MNESVKQIVEEFFQKYPQRKLRAHEIIFFSNDDPTHIHYLLSGSVGQYDVTEKGQQLMVNIFRPPAFFPMSHAMNKTPNEFLYETLEETTVRIAPNADVINFIKREPTVLYDLLARVYKGTDGLLRRTALLMEGNTASRLLFELIVSCVRFGESDGQGGYRVQIKESDLAARTGLARETISRHLKLLKAHKVIESSTGEIFVPKLSVLEKQLYSDGHLDVVTK